MNYLIRGARDIVKYFNDEKLTIEEAKGSLAFGFIAAYMGSVIVEEMCDEYPEAGEWVDTFIASKENEEA